MTGSALDATIRAAVVQIVETSPAAPSYDDLPSSAPIEHRHTDRRWRGPIVSAFVAILLVIGAVVLAVRAGSDPPSRTPHAQARTHSPTTDVVATPLSVTALASLSFDQQEYTVPSGRIHLAYSGAAGHTLVFEDPALSQVLLTTDAGGPHTATVDLRPGTYQIFCSVPGHQAAGMQATILVTDARS